MVNENNQSKVPEASFNQAGYQQLRLHELFTKIDRMSEMPFTKIFISPKVYIHNFDLILRDLVSCFSTISAKVAPEEKKVMRQKREAIEDSLINDPPARTRCDHLGKMRPAVSISAWRKLNNLLLDYRDELERLMEKYGFGNPSKESEGGFD